MVRERPEVIRKWAEMEFFLGLPMMDIGLEKQPSPSMLMEGLMLSMLATSRPNPSLLFQALFFFF